MPILACVTIRHFAHSLEGSTDTSRWEPLQDHLLLVAAMAEEFASKFGGAKWGRLAGLWHDIGKYSDEFQNYLLSENGFETHAAELFGRVDHSTAGAQHAHNTKSTGGLGRILAYAIAGHHAGLTDAHGEGSSLESRLKKTIPAYSDAPLEILDPGISISATDLPMAPERGDFLLGFRLSFFTRMVFSALVDADFLATEKYLNEQKSGMRTHTKPSLAQMQAALNEFLAIKAQRAVPGEVNESRLEVLSACRASATLSPGFFSLTVPTGGGKTFSSLAFALDHAAAHNLDRVIYSIPFTSIIEQTAGAFREVFTVLGPDCVVEHHSNLDPVRETQRSRLAAENWDARLIVTTSVQFLESLFANRPGRCRKLHNIARSVIILDEAQTLPVDLLNPILAALSELVTNYGCTVVLCTATQPALLKRDEFPIGLDQQEVREIIPEPQVLYESMKRVSVELVGPLSDDELIGRLNDHESFLTIVNTRPHAAKLFRQLQSELGGGDELFHLSTFMCGQHRAEKIAEIRERLKQQRPCRVISTSLIEAGVDVDFPVVYRAKTGLDSIAQAAGRCNREGRLASGKVFVFEPAGQLLRGSQRAAAESLSQIIPDHHDDLLSPPAIHDYFRMHYWKKQGDSRWDNTSKGSVLACFDNSHKLPWKFRTAADLFRLIEDSGQAVFVDSDHDRREGVNGRTPSYELIEQLRVHGPNRELLRRLQRHTVSVPKYAFDQMLKSGDIGPIAESFYVLTNPGSYDQECGLRMDCEGVWPADAMLC
jgi:CRISPR-associated endonuclease/helicase Cas3